MRRPTGSWARAGVLLVAALVGSCGDDTGELTGQPSARALYGPAVRRVVFEVDYAPGAEPYTGPVTGLGDTWRVLTENVQRLFQGAGKTLEVPTSLGQMQRITATGQDFTTDQVIALSRQYRDRPSAGDAASFHVIFLNGYYRDAGGRRTDVLGASFGNTGVLAMFKPVIAATSTVDNVRRFVEQSTLVHEFGHAAGLVNNGLPSTTAHLDTAHGPHCANELCVMNYSNEGATAAVQFALRFMRTGSIVLYDQACLDDAAAVIRASN